MALKKEDLEYKEPLNTIPVYPDKESSSSETKKVPIKRVKSKLPTRKEDLNYMDVLNDIFFAFYDRLLNPLNALKPNKFYASSFV